MQGEPFGQAGMQRCGIPATLEPNLATMKYRI